MNLHRHLRESAPPLLAFALMFACAAGWALGPRGASAAGSGQQRGEQKPEEEAKSSVYGRAAYEGTGRPVRRARVVLIRTEDDGPSYEALTDSLGEFRFRGVRAGRYLVAVDQPGLLTPYSFAGLEERFSNGAVEREEVYKLFETVEVDGKADREVAVRARRGGAMSGRITYADGSPAVGVQVHVIRRREGRLERIVGGMGRIMPGVNSANSLRTDDRGTFRVAGLPPGDYLVAVSEAAAHAEKATSASDGVENPAQTTFDFLIQPLLMTFHPSASDVTDAKVVSVSAGEENDGVDVLIPDRELRTLAGVVRSRGMGRPVTGAKVTLVRRGADAGFDDEYAAFSETAPTVAKTDEHGRWRLKDIPDGPYTIYVTPAEEYEQPAEDPDFDGNLSQSLNRNGSPYEPPRRKRRYSPAHREVEVTADAPALDFELGEGARISGTVVAEGGKELPRGSNVYVFRATHKRGEGFSQRTFHANVRGSEFSIEGVPPGDYFVYYEAFSFERPSRHHTRSVSWNGKDITRAPLTVGEGTKIEGVRVLISSEGVTARLRVLRGDKRPARGVFVFLLPADLAGEWRPYAHQFNCMTEADGSCEINAPPGAYVAISLARGRRAPDETWAEMRRLAAAGPRVLLRAGEAKTVELIQPDDAR